MPLSEVAGLIRLLELTCGLSAHRSSLFHPTTRRPSRGIRRCRRDAPASRYRRAIVSSGIVRRAPASYREPLRRPVLKVREWVGTELAGTAQTSVVNPRRRTCDSGCPTSGSDSVFVPDKLSTADGSRKRRRRTGIGVGRCRMRSVPCGTWWSRSWLSSFGRMTHSVSVLLEALFSFAIEVRSGVLLPRSLHDEVRGCGVLRAYRPLVEGERFVSSRDRGRDHGQFIHRAASGTGRPSWSTGWRCTALPPVRG